MTIEAVSISKQEATNDFDVPGEELQRLAVPLGALEGAIDQILLNHLELIREPGDLAMLTYFALVNVTIDKERVLRFVPIEVQPDTSTITASTPRTQDTKHIIKPIPVQQITTVDEAVEQIQLLTRKEPHRAALIALASGLSQPGKPAIITSSRDPAGAPMRTLTVTRNKLVDEFFNGIAPFSETGLLEIPSLPEDSTRRVAQVSSELWRGSKVFKDAKTDVIDPVFSFSLPLRVTTTDAEGEKVDYIFVVQVGLNRLPQLSIEGGMMNTLRVLQRVAEADLERALTGRESIRQELKHLSQLLLLLDMHDIRSPLTAPVAHLKLMQMRYPKRKTALEELIEKVKAGSATKEEIQTTLETEMDGLDTDNNFSSDSLTALKRSLSVIDETTTDLENETIEPETIHIKSLLLEIRDELTADCAERNLPINIHFNLNVIDDDTRIIGVVKFLRKKLWNALRNSLQHGASNFEVTCDKLSDTNGNRQNPVVLMMIADNGEGATDDYIEQINSPASQGVKSTHGGLGKGLNYIAKADRVVGALTGITDPILFANADTTNGNNRGFVIVSKYCDTT